MDTYDEYIAALRSKNNLFIQEMEAYAEVHHIPIMQNSAIETFLGLLSIQRPTHILEIGSAIGYSAIRMAQLLEDVTITTIELNPLRVEKAIEFIHAASLEKRIQIIEADALEGDVDYVLNDEYDALFIDAAKGQYQRYFEKYSPAVEIGGVIYCDNMFMHGMVLRDDQDVPRRKRTMIRNIKEFTNWIMTNPNYDTTLLPVGDGLLIAVKK